MTVDPIHQFKINNLAPLFTIKGHEIAFTNSALYMLFMFVLFANMIGLIPFSFTVTSQLIITATLALLVFFIVVIYGFWRNGFKFLKLFVPKGVPIYILPAIVVIEVLSFVSRPISHSVRLFANMLAGHITLQVFAGFIIMLAGFGIAGWFGAAIPLLLVIMLTALEFLVAFLQAYVFAILTCIYLNDAIHPGHCRLIRFLIVGILSNAVMRARVRSSTR